MGYNYVIDHTRVNYTTGNSGRLYIVLHYTGNNTDTAKANANYFRGANRGASAHLFVDESDVYEVVSLDDSAWAVGIDYGGNLFGICTNSNSISIEMCSSGGKIADRTINNAVSLTKSLMQQYGIPADRVVRHWDVCGKSCPGWAGWLPGNESIWNDFKSRLTDGENAATDKKETRNEGRETTMQCFYTVDGKGPVIYFDGKEFHPLSHQDEMTVLNSIYKANNGKDMPCFSWQSKAPWYARLQAAVKRTQK